MVYRRGDIRKIYDRITSRAQKENARGHYEKTLKYIRAAAIWAYHFNELYYDRNLEALLKEVGDKLLKKETVENKKTNRYVLIDSYCIDNKGLTQQYIQGFIDKGCELLYVVTGDTTEEGQNIKRQLEGYDKAWVITFDGAQRKFLYKENQIVEQIKKFGAEKILYHISPWDITALLVCNAFTDTINYNINLTSHAFWLGASFFDYNLEFCSHGLALSERCRGFKPEQLLTVPYYPIISDSTDSHPLPEKKDGDMVILTGGAPYKMMGADGMFFKIMDAILDVSESLKIWVAGFLQDAAFEKLLSKMKHSDRVSVIGRRSDISTVFRQCDLYLNTYPIGGGLMTQYAAIFGKPIFCYHSEQDFGWTDPKMVVNQVEDNFHTQESIAEMAEYARRLCNDTQFREKESEKLKRCVITPDKFTEMLFDSLENHKPIINWSYDMNVFWRDMPKIVEDYLNTENLRGFPGTSRVIGCLRGCSLPIFYDHLPIVMTVIKKKINKK